MNRRAFITALLGTVAAAALLPLDTLTPATTPKWLEQAATLNPGDIFTIDGVYAVNPLTGESTGLPLLFVVANEDPVQVYPMMMAEGPHRNVSALPSHDAELRPLFIGETVPIAVTWLEA